MIIAPKFWEIHWKIIDVNGQSLEKHSIVMVRWQQIHWKTFKSSYHCWSLHGKDMFYQMQKSTLESWSKNPVNQTCDICKAFRSGMTLFRLTQPLLEVKPKTCFKEISQECCLVSLLIVRKQRLSRIQFSIVRIVISASTAKSLYSWQGR